ncbi:hypothetical protein SBBP2_890022 [Burkholderiales bacterium]|jgi:hypothetical protein|nr:hypothetical protein SBBP2_890022 [Burkholderiales bacterium]
MTSAGPIDPGPLAPPERVRPARDEALALLKAIYPLNLSHAADLIRDNPPSPDAVAMLGFIAHAVFASARNRSNKGREHPQSLAAQIRKHDIKSLADAEKRAPHLLDGSDVEQKKRTITKAISKVKRRQMSP